MLRTRLCELLGIEHPVIQASLGPWSSVDLAAAVSNAGGIGSLGTALIPPQEIKRQIELTRELTSKPFIVNHTLRPLNEEAFALTLEARPAVVSLALGDPGDLVKRVHDAGALFIQQVHTVRQAERAAELGVDVIIAQGGEAGGFGGIISTMAIVPQVVDAVSPVPVVAAGGIADGRGLAAALALGAQGVNVGTRFLASPEAHISREWLERLVSANSEDAGKIEFAEAVFPPAGPGGYSASPRVLKTPFVEKWNAHKSEIGPQAGRLGKEMLAAVRDGRGHEYVPFTGQSTGLVHEIFPAGEIVRRMVADAEEILKRSAQLIEN